MCPACNKEVPADMALCGYCGASLSKQGSPLTAPPSSGARKPEEKLWSGSYSFRAVAHQWLLYVLWLGLLGFIWFNIPAEQRKNEIYLYVAAALATLPLLWLVLKVLYRKLSLRYELTNERIFKTRGILLRSKDEVELIRVDDLQVKQSLFNRIFNVGTVILYSPTDKTDPELHLEGIVDPHTVKEKIREFVRKLKDKSIRMEQI